MKLRWERSRYLPEPFLWLASSSLNRPAIWARKREDGIWIVQFAHKQYGFRSTGKTRDEAAANLLSEWVSSGKRPLYA